MELRINRENLKVWILLVIFMLVCLALGYYFGMQHNLNYANDYYKNYMEQFCICQ